MSNHYGSLDALFTRTIIAMRRDVERLMRSHQTDNPPPPVAIKEGLRANINTGSDRWQHYRNEIQEIVIATTVTGGTWTIKYQHATRTLTPVLARNCTAAQVQAALDSIGSGTGSGTKWAAGEIAVTGGPGGTSAFNLTYSGPTFKFQDVSSLVTSGSGGMLSVSGNSLTGGGTPMLTVGTVQNGGGYGTHTQDLGDFTFYNKSVGGYPLRTVNYPPQTPTPPAGALAGYYPYVDAATGEAILPIEPDGIAIAVSGLYMLTRGFYQSYQRWSGPEGDYARYIAIDIIRDRGGTETVIAYGGGNSADYYAYGNNTTNIIKEDMRYSETMLIYLQAGDKLKLAMQMTPGVKVINPGDILPRITCIRVV